MKNKLALCALLLASVASSFGQAVSGDYMLPRLDSAGLLDYRPVTPAVGRLIGWPADVNIPKAIEIGSGLSLSSLGVLTATGGAPAWSDITGKPTTLSGFGITNGQPLDDDLTAIAALSTATFGRGLLSVTSAALARAVLEIGPLNSFTFSAERRLLTSSFFSTTPTETSLSGFLDWASSTQGAVLYRGALGWGAMSPGTAGQVFTSGGAGANPSWTTVTGGVGGALGATDNAIVRADGTAGGTAQGGAATVTDAGAPTFYDKVTLAKTGTTTTGGFEVFADPLNPGNDSLYILPPSTSNRIYYGKTGQLVGAINYQGASNENFGNIISTSGHYQIIEYGATGISLFPFNGPVNLAPAVASGVKVVDTFVEMSEMTAPSAPASDKGRYYFEDNGSGKTRFMVKFPTGAAKQIAIED